MDNVEEWAFTGYDGYYVSTFGRVLGPGRHGKQKIMTPTHASLNGHLEVNMYVNGERFRDYIHRLVAKAFIPNPKGHPIVRHLDGNPSNNNVWNLAWGTQKDNMHDAINSGTFRYLTDEDRELAMQKRRMPVRAKSFLTGEEFSFESQQEASRKLGIEQSAVYSVLSGRSKSAKGYYFVAGDDETPIDISSKTYSIRKGLIKATSVSTGQEILFRGQTEAAKALEMSIASVSNVLRGKVDQACGYRFEYIPEEGDIHD